MTALRAHLDSPPRRISAGLGFDGFIDTIYRVERGGGEWYENSKDLAAFLASASGQNHSLGLTFVARKLGGNMPLFACALAHLGADVTGVGMVGAGKPHPIFAAEPGVRWVGYEEPVETIALEFESGKLFLADTEVLEKVGWEAVADRVDAATVRAAFAGKDIVALTNWGEMRHATEIWRALIDEVLRVPGAAPKLLVVDLADGTRRSQAETDELFVLLAEAARTARVALILNEGEARLVHQRSGASGDSDVGSLDILGEGLLARLGVHEIVIRNAWASAAWSRDRGSARMPTLHTASPVVRTGAGDNFNAGYAFARAQSWDVDAALALGVSTAGAYVRTGASSSLEDVIRLLRGERVVRT
ncbi:PfkB family carbohydrate kinase [Streptomyces sp. NPDC004838]